MLQRGSYLISPAQTEQSKDQLPKITHTLPDDKIHPNHHLQDNLESSIITIEEQAYLPQTYEIKVNEDDKRTARLKLAR